MQPVNPLILIQVCLRQHLIGECEIIRDLFHHVKWHLCWIRKKNTCKGVMIDLIKLLLWFFYCLQLKICNFGRGIWKILRSTMHFFVFSSSSEQTGLCLHVCVWHVKLHAITPIMILQTHPPEDCCRIPQTDGCLLVKIYKENRQRNEE